MKLMDMFIRKQDVILREIHGLYYLIDIKCNYNSDGHSIPTLNDVGKTIWESLEVPAQIDDIVEKITKLFDVSNVPKNEIRTDIENYILMLIQMGYVTNVR